MCTRYTWYVIILTHENLLKTYHRSVYYAGCQDEYGIGFRTQLTLLE